jgi:hypothetical protein
MSAALDIITVGTTNIAVFPYKDSFRVLEFNSTLPYSTPVAEIPFLQTSKPEQDSSTSLCPVTNRFLTMFQSQGVSTGCVWRLASLASGGSSGGAGSDAFNSSLRVDRCDITMPPKSYQMSTNCAANDWIVAYTLENQIQVQIVPLTDWNVDQLGPRVTLTNPQSGTASWPKVVSSNDAGVVYLVAWMEQANEKLIIKGSILDSTSAITHQFTLLNEDMKPNTLAVTYLSKVNKFAVVAQTTVGKGALSLVDPITGQVQYTSQQSNFYLPLGPPPSSILVSANCESTDEYLSFPTAPTGSALIRISQKENGTLAQLVQILPGQPARQVWTSEGTGGYFDCNSQDQNNQMFMLNLAKDELLNIQFKPFSTSSGIKNKSILGVLFSLLMLML